MVEITDQARLKIVELMEKSETGVLGLRLGAESVSPLKINFSLAFITDGQEKPDDTVIPFEGFDLYVDPDSAPNIEVAVVDYVDGLMGSGFKIENPSLGTPELSGPVTEKIQRVLEDQINPAVASHGGYVSLIDIKDNIVYLQLGRPAPRAAGAHPAPCPADDAARALRVRCPRRNADFASTDRLWIAPRTRRRRCPCR